MTDNDPAAQDFAAWLNATLGNEALKPADRATLIAEVLDRYHLKPEDAAKLAEVADEDLDQVASTLPRRPQRDPGQGSGGGGAPPSDGRESLENAIRDAFNRADGRGAWSETTIRR
jgi:hypothetical protein